MKILRTVFEVSVPIDSSFVMIRITNAISDSSSSTTKSKDSQFIDVDLFDNFLFMERMEAEIVLKSPNKSSRSSTWSCSVSDVLKISSNDSFNTAVCSLRFFTDVSANRMADVI